MKKYYSKILLFGEYTILSGSKALTIPYSRYYGCLEFQEEQPKNAMESNKILKELYNYLVNQKSRFYLDLDFSAFSKDLQSGLFFNSDIPYGYGLGSSGAVIAAIFDRYTFTDKAAKFDQRLLRKDMALAESFFHGTSSGIDPFSIYKGVPALFQGDQTSFPDKDTIDKYVDCFYLMDSGIKAGTSELVRNYQLKLERIEFNKNLFEAYIPAINASIEIISGMRKEELKGYIRFISQFQFEHFNEYIPDRMQDIWQLGLLSDEFYIKLCGSGGGGYLLLWTDKPIIILKNKFKINLNKIVHV